MQIELHDDEQTSETGDNGGDEPAEPDEPTLTKGLPQCKFVKLQRMIGVAEAPGYSAF